MSVRIINETTGEVIAQNVNVADSFWLRLRGLLFRNKEFYNHGLVLVPCNRIHTFGMKYPINVLFISKEDKVLRIIEPMNPGQTSPKIRAAVSVIELPVERPIKVKIGEKLCFINEESGGGPYDRKNKY